MDLSPQQIAEIGLPYNGSDWNEDRVAKLKLLFDEGNSASQIAKALGGTTRNAVIGKINRMFGATRKKPETPWSDAEIKVLTSLWNAGKSINECRFTLSSEFGVLRSRGGLGAKIDRLGLPKRERKIAFKRPKKIRFGETMREKKRRRPLNENRALRARIQFEAIEIVNLSPEESATAVGLLDLNAHTCRWPLGDPRDLEAMKFCGAEPQSEKPYCTRHCCMAYERKSA